MQKLDFYASNSEIADENRDIRILNHSAYDSIYIYIDTLIHLQLLLRWCQLLAGSSTVQNHSSSQISRFETNL